MEKKTLKKSKPKKKETTKEVKPNYFKSLKAELSKVKWPDGKDVVKYTIATLVFVVILALFFEGLNFIEAFVKGLFS